jgi:chromate transporter
MSAIIGLLALTALFRYKTGVIPVIFACGLAGLVYQLAL